MSKPLEGVRILEVAQAAFVPSAGQILVDWGAQVIKVEHPEHGDMARGIKVLGVDPHPSGVQYLWEIFNRGKRSVGLDVGHPDGYEALLRLVAPEPKACVGVAPPPAPTTTARPATVRPPATQPPSGIPEVRPPLGPTERAPFRATAQCRDGTFVYTPGTTYTGQDSFQVTVSDARDGFHIHGAAGLLNLFTFGLLGSSGHRTTQSVLIGSERATVVSGLNSPVDFRFLPDGRILVAEKNGAIRVVENGVLRTAPLITLAVRTETERGIGGLAVDPDFSTNGRLYVAYVAADTTRNTLSRLVVDGNTATLDQILVQSTLTAAPNHHGGALGFGPDRALYWGVGDNASGSNAQNLDNIHGKILRLNTDGSVPDDNPVIDGRRTLIYAYGLRNPFRLTFTPTGELLVADVGNAAFEEVNKITAGGNYGWPNAEGLCTSNCAGKIDPIYTYPREGGAAITSVVVHRGKVFIADTVRGWIRTLTCTPGYTSCGDVTTFDPNAGATVVLAEGPDGALYQLVYQPGRLVRIDLADPSDLTRV